MATNTTRYLTSIPTTQPNCGQLSIDNPSPHCISNSTSDPMGCFVQPTGLYCAPISTTRGFLYDPSSSSSTPANNTNTNPTTTTVPIYINLIPKLSTVTSTNNTLDISGQPVLTKGPAGLGQTCVGIPYPSQTDPSWSLLVTMANKRLNETVGNPGIGAGTDVA
ncbi:hypothetical protein BGZ46_008152 [Entomortierella lignicola]|nr:hypothetical protein BGZ46_008152 [Entomortierella lignicola]